MSDVGAGTPCARPQVRKVCSCPVFTYGPVSQANSGLPANPPTPPRNIESCLPPTLHAKPILGEKTAFASGKTPVSMLPSEEFDRSAGVLLGERKKGTSILKPVVTVSFGVMFQRSCV